MSRALDPQIHTHVVVLKPTRRKDGEWRALDNESLYRLKMMLGAFYRAELARELQALGYEIQVTHADGRFELSGYRDAQVAQFSQRSRDIEETLREKNGTDREHAPAWLKKLIAVTTREKKTEVDRQALLKDWQKRSAEVGISYAIPNESSSGEKHVQRKNALEVLDEAIEHLSERESVFTRNDLLRFALERGTGHVTLDEITTAIVGRIQSGLLIQSEDNFTTADAQKLESEILSSEFRGRFACSPIFSNNEMPTNELTGLSLGQQSAAKAILQTSSRVIGIQGRAGSGKTTLLRAVLAIACERGYRLTGLAPSSSAARELSKSGIEATTITSFQHRPNKGLDDHTILIVDEAGMVSTKQLHNILLAAEQSECRVVLVGDTQQLKAVEAGSPFAQLQNAGMHTAIVEENQRQKNPILKRAVEMAASGKIALAVDLLQKHIVEIQDHSSRFDRIANDYALLSAEERSGTRVVSGTRYARAEINTRIREKLGLSGQGTKFEVLERKDMTASQTRMTLSYQIDDVLIAEKNYKSLGIDRGQLVEIVDRRADSITLLRPDNKRVEWRPSLAPNFSAFTRQVRELSVGDIVRVTANLHHMGLINGDIGKVGAIEEAQGITLELDNGRCVVLNCEHPMMIDYGYCSTVHSSQGQTCDRVLIDADTQTLTANESTFYVAISRARHEAHIYTDDREYLPLAMGRSLEKTIALEMPRASELAL